MPEKNKILSIDAYKLKELMDNNPDLLVINVLSEMEHQHCHIKGSINIPVESMLEKMASLDKDKEIVVYGAMPYCQQCQTASLLLYDLGFAHLYLYTGGIQDWIEKKFETAGACKN